MLCLQNMRRRIRNGTIHPLTLSQSWEHFCPKGYLISSRDRDCQNWWKWLEFLLPRNQPSWLCCTYEKMWFTISAWRCYVSPIIMYYAIANLLSVYISGDHNSSGDKREEKRKIPQSHHPSMENQNWFVQLFGAWPPSLFFPITIAFVSAKSYLGHASCKRPQKTSITLK